MDPDCGHHGYEKERLVSASQPPTYGIINSSASQIAPTNHPECDTSSVADCEAVKTYKRRWYILLMFSFLTATQSGIWNTWGPLTQSANYAFGWSLGDVALLTNWGCITYIISMFFFSWVMDVKGLRWACLSSGGLVAVGSALRCITSEPVAAKWLINVGHILNGFAGPVAMAGPTSLSAVWFPADQRTTATSIGLLTSSLGVAVSFIIGPLMVPDVPSGGNSSSSSHDSTSSFTMSIAASLDSNNSSSVLQTRYYIMRLMYVECGWSCLLFLAMLLYFPAKPPTAPSVTATIDRVNFRSGLKQLLRHTTFWKIGICYAVSIGVCDIWMSFIDPILNSALTAGSGKSIDHQVEAGWLGFYGSIASSVAGLAVARFSDVYSRHMKLLLLLLFATSLLGSIAFALDAAAYIPTNVGCLYAGYIITSVGLQGSTPLFYELACESTYPIAEGVTNGLLTWLNNAVGLLFLLVLMCPNIGTDWMNWTMVGSVAVCIPIILFHRSHYNRLDIDAPVVPVNLNINDSRQQSIDELDNNTEQLIT